MTERATEQSAPNPHIFRIPTVAELDAMRVARGLTQKELSRRAGCEPGRFNTILHRDMDPQTETMRSFLAVLRATEPRSDGEITRRGPKPRPSALADRLDQADPDADRAGGDGDGRHDG